jgi:hypothetical protein
MDRAEAEARAKSLGRYVFYDDRGERERERTVDVTLCRQPDPEISTHRKLQLEAEFKRGRKSKGDKKRAAKIRNAMWNK